MIISSLVAAPAAFHMGLSPVYSYLRQLTPCSHTPPSSHHWPQPVHTAFWEGCFQCNCSCPGIAWLPLSPVAPPLPPVPASQLWAAGSAGKQWQPWRHVLAMTHPARPGRSCSQVAPAPAHGAPVPAPSLLPPAQLSTGDCLLHGVARVSRNRLGIRAGAASCSFSCLAGHLLGSGSSITREA